MHNYSKSPKGFAKFSLDIFYLSAKQVVPSGHLYTTTFNRKTMENTQPTTGKYSLNFGLLLGAIGVAFQLMLFFVDAHYDTQNPVITVVNIVLSVGVIFWGILSYKKANGGYLKIGEAVKMGAGIGLISGIISILYSLLLTNVLDPEYMSKMMDLRLAESAQQMTSEQLQQAKEMGMKFFWFGYPIMLIVSVLFGLLIGLVGGLIFKKSAEG